MDVEAGAHGYGYNSLGQLQRGMPSDSGTSFLSDEQTLNGKVPKTRKPYTITKQRERWSDEEHLRFVEALKLYGRAWRKIEEHIGTKTAVQIRSHAQKFFNKLEKKKEAGEAPDKEDDITIPPPRPKRKPAKPYPRKDGVTASGFTDTSQQGHLSQHLHSSSFSQPLQQSGFLNGYEHSGSHSAGLHHAAAHLLNQLSLAHANSNEVTDATVAAVTTAASAAAAAAAAAVVAAAGHEVQSHMQVHPPNCFPFFGLPPSMLAQIMPSGVAALDHAALLAQQTVIAKAAAAAAAQYGGQVAAAGAAGPGARDCNTAAAAAVGPAGVEPMAGNDRGLIEATGTTDCTHISANTQPQGSDGDSACSRETDNQDNCPTSHAMDASWHSRLGEHAAFQQEQHDPDGNRLSAAAAAARSLVGMMQSPGFDFAECARSGGAGSGFSPAQALALLSNPLFIAATRRHVQQQPEAAVTVAAGTPGAAACSSGGHAASSGGDCVAVDGAGSADVNADVNAGLTVRSKVAVASVNSGSIGPPAGTKRLLEQVSDELARLPKKPAVDVSDRVDDAEGEAEGMEVSPSSPSIHEKALKAASQPSNTNGNTSGSNESDGSKRRHGTAQAEGSNPTHGNSSGNGYSVKDSNTATNTATNGNTTHGNCNGYSSGNGTSAFHPHGHQHLHHTISQQLPGPSNRYNQHTHGSRHTYQQQHRPHGAAAEGSNGFNGASGTGLCARDEGRSSSDLEGPSHQQQQRWQDVNDDLMEEQDGEEQEQQQQQQHQGNAQAAQLHAIMASLHSICDNQMAFQQAYGAAAAAAAAATAQQMVASAMQHNQHPLQRGEASAAAAAAAAAATQNHFAFLQQQQQVRQANSNAAAQAAAAAVSHAFAPWQHGNAAGNAFSHLGSLLGNSVSSHMAQQGQSLAAQQLQMQAAAGLVDLAGSWGQSGPQNTNSSGSGSMQHGLGSNLGQLFAHQRQQRHDQRRQQAAREQHMSAGMVQGEAGQSAAAAMAAAAGLHQLQHSLGP